MTPQLRFSEFTDTWQAMKLGEVGTVSMCKRIFKEQTKPSGDIPFYKIGTFGKTADAFIDKSLYEEYKQKYSFPEVGDILISAAGTIGRLVVYDGSPSYFQDSNIVWIANDESKVVNKFLFYCYLNIQWTTEDTTIARLYNGNLRRISIVIPSKPEQQKIADFLTTVDDKISALEQKVEKLETYKRGVMQKIFSQQIRFTRPDGSQYPEWETKKLSDISMPVTDRVKSEFSDVVLTNSAVRGVIPQTDFFNKEIAVQGNLSNYYQVQKDDFIYNPRISASAPVGPLNRNKYGEGVLSPLYSVFRFKNQNLDFFEQYFKTSHWHRYMKSVANYGARHDRMAITSNDLKSMPLPYPSIEEQQKIADFLSVIDQKITLTTQQLEKTKEFKRGLLQRMFV